MQELDQILDQIEARANAATPGPWSYEAGGGHAYNRIVGSESVQTNGWPHRINGVSNASYTDRICENLGDDGLPYPAANIDFIASARTDVPALLEAVRELIDGLDHSRSLNSRVLREGNRDRTIKAVAAILSPASSDHKTEDSGK